MKTKTSLLASFRTLIATAIAATYPLAAPAAPTSPSEMLEKGIYNQETKGDLDSAITIYQQLVAEANVNQSLAPQAQFRLGQCYLQKNRPTEAKAAFEKLIHDFPNEKELVAKAREHLPGDLVLGPVPWADGERLQLNVALLSGVDLGTVEYRADLVQNVNGRRIWRVGARMTAGPQSVSSVDADAEMFRPLTSHWKHSLLGEVSAVYRSGEVEVRRVGKAQPDIIPLEHVEYDNEQAMGVMRRLPLQVGYKTTLPVVSTLGGNANIPIPLEVSGKEMVEVPAGKFDCFQVKLGLVNQTFWFSDDAHRYLVKFEAGPAVAALMSITLRRPGEAVQFRDNELGVSLTAPADWVIWRARNGQPEGQVLIRTLDPQADTDDGGLRLFKTDTLSEAAQCSARAWAEEHLSKKKHVKVQPDQWKNVTIDGRQGVSLVAEYTEGGKTYKHFLAYVLGAKDCELFTIASAPEKFDGLKAQFDSILTSYRRQ